jgi:hypothetical protein
MSVKKREIIRYIIWTAFGASLLFTSLFVYFMHGDDYGYASLSFGVVEPDVVGTNYSSSQFFSYLQKHYMVQNGRVIFHGIASLLLKNIWITRIVYSAAFLVIFIMLHRLAAGTYANVKTALFCCILYGVFSVQMFRNGFYFYSAFANYVLPLVFFFAGWLAMQRIEEQASKQASNSLATDNRWRCLFLSGQCLARAERFYGCGIFRNYVCF